MRDLHRPFAWLLTLMLCTAGMAGSAGAALPTQVDGKELPSLAPMLENAIPAVVNISAEGRVLVQDPFFDDPMFRRFFGVPEQPRARRTQSLGSGVIVDAAQGYVLTNNHVIAKADRIHVRLHDGRQFDAEVVGTDPDSDVAVLRIPADDLDELPVADSDRVRVGDFVVAIGSPFGLGQTVTSGIISALGRSGLGIEGYEDFIQTDASINPGNSGGALVNLRGELVGINTAILSRSGGNIGIGFAIPINMASAIMAQLLEHGEVRRGSLGIFVQDLTPELADAFHLDPRNGGAVVARVAPASPADRAGLRSGDVITAVDGRRVRNAADLRNTIGLLGIGQTIEVEILRDGRRQTLSTTIAAPQSSQLEGDSLDPRLDGITLGNIDESSPLFGRVEGVVVVEARPGSPGWRAGLRPNDVVVSANRRPVNQVEDLRAALRNHGGHILLNIRRGDGALFLLLR